MSCSGWDTHLGKVHSLTIVPKTNLQINGNRFQEHSKINQTTSTARLLLTLHSWIDYSRIDDTSKKHTGGKISTKRLSEQALITIQRGKELIISPLIYFLQKKPLENY